MKPASILIIIAILVCISCGKQNHVVLNRNLRIEFDSRMKSRISNLAMKNSHLMNDFSASEYLQTTDKDFMDFDLKAFASEKKTLKLGASTQYTVKGECRDGDNIIEKILVINVPDSFPDVALYQVAYVNHGNDSLEVKGWVNNAYSVQKGSDSPAFWSFQGSSSSMRSDWILPVNQGFSKENYMGMNNSDYGGGIPLIDIWRRDGGLAVGSVELLPRLISLPVSMKKKSENANIQVEFAYEMPEILVPNDTLRTYTTLVGVHQGDYFSSLQRYSKVMQHLGIQMKPSPDEAFEAVWCAWGYMRKFTLDEVYGTLPKVRELGLKWVDIDDGYQRAEGDWEVSPARFPGGNKAMKQLTDKIHSFGMKAKLWWAPLAADPGSELLKKDPKLILQNEEGVPRYITWWDSYLMSPAYKGTLKHTSTMVHMFLQDWGFDGLKMDGQHLNCVPPDYNPAHKLDYPEQSCELLPAFFKMIYDSATTIKSNAVIQNCPCGDAVSFYNIPYMNQAVASDPTSSRQIRQKGKTYKAINPGLAYYGDHVELSDGGNDFASQIGIGAVLGTKFTWPKDNPFVTEGHFVLTPEKEEIWKQWISIYNNKMLSKETYLGDLYDIGYDLPETHVIQKGDTLFYAFYADQWDGKIELRGLGKKQYIIKDYVNNLGMGKVNVNSQAIDAHFKKSLLIEAFPSN